MALKRCTDLAKCYQRAAGLALMIGTEIDRVLTVAYLHGVATDDDQNDLFRRVKDSEELAMHV